MEQSLVNRFAHTMVAEQAAVSVCYFQHPFLRLKTHRPYTCRSDWDVVHSIWALLPLQAAEVKGLFCAEMYQTKLLIRNCVCADRR